MKLFFKKKKVCCFFFVQQSSKHLNDTFLSSKRIAPKLRKEKQFNKFIYSDGSRHKCVLRCTAMMKCAQAIYHHIIKFQITQFDLLSVFIFFYHLSYDRTSHSIIIMYRLTVYDLIVHSLTVHSLTVQFDCTVRLYDLTVRFGLLLCVNIV